MNNKGKIPSVRLAEKNNSTRRRWIWVRLQGAFAGAYLGYVPVDATPQTGAKTSKMVELFFPPALNLIYLSTVITNVNA